MTRMWHTSNSTITRLLAYLFKRNQSNKSDCRQAGCEMLTQNNLEVDKTKITILLKPLASWLHWIHSISVPSAFTSCLILLKVSLQARGSVPEMPVVQGVHFQLTPAIKEPPETRLHRSIHGWKCVKCSDSHACAEKRSAPPFTETSHSGYGWSLPLHDT